MNSKTRNLLIAGIVLVAIVFLIGFVPQYQRASALEAELSQSRQRVQQLERDVRLARARDLASLTYVELTKNNFGTASELATRFFSEIGALVDRTEDPQLRNELQAILTERDTVVAGLATADPSMQAAIRQILERLFKASNAG